MDELQPRTPSRAEILRDLDLVASESERLTCGTPLSDAEITRAYSFAALAHAGSLLRAVGAVLSSSSIEGVVVLARAHTEAAMLSLYLRLDGAKAIDALKAHEAAELGLWARYPPGRLRDELESMSAAAAKDVKPERLQPHEVVSRVEALLGAEGFTDFFHRTAYKLLSQGGAHANLRLIKLYLRPRGRAHVEVGSDQQGNVSPDETAVYSLVAHAFTASNVLDPTPTPIAEEIHNKYLLG